MTRRGSRDFNCPIVDNIDSAMAHVSQFFPEMPVQDVRLARMIRDVAGEMSTRFDRHLRPHGLNETDFRCLMQLISSPGGQAYPSDLSQLATESRANMTRIVDSLVERGWVTRRASETDRRRIVLAVTAEGIALARSLLPTFHPALSAILSVLTELEKEAMILGLQRIAASLNSQPREGSLK